LRLLRLRPRRLSSRLPSRKAVRRVNARKAKGNSGAKIVRLVRSVLRARLKAEVENVAIGPQAIALMVTAPAAIEARAATVLVVGGHSRWRRRLNLKN
jgi:hypothetical protein